MSDETATGEFMVDDDEVIRLVPGGVERRLADGSWGFAAWPAGPKGDAFNTMREPKERTADDE